MIHCVVCGRRIRPPKLPWTDTADGVRFYRATWDPKAYGQFLEALAKKVQFAHEECLGKERATKPCLVALNLETRRSLRQLRAHDVSSGFERASRTRRQV